MVRFAEAGSLSADERGSAHHPTERQAAQNCHVRPSGSFRLAD
ncbi:hypothetical protein Pd630_LPD09191 (plasmid) [Rhodococcus opacus PD630]|nr:hypothetical protein Pd630_LPD09191 [Rhodococcus opacus PD630]